MNDTEILDWLEAQGRHYTWAIQLETDYPFVTGCVFVCRNVQFGAKTLREAVVAKIEAEKARVEKELKMKEAAEEDAKQRRSPRKKRR